MADSDNTTTLPFVTRRSMLAATAVAPVVLTYEPRGVLADNPARASAPPDPALLLWQEWEAAHRLTERLCRRQQQLETKLVKRVGFPSACVRLPQGEEVILHSLDAIYDVLGNGSDTIAVRGKAEAEFAAHQARWDAAAEELGYTAALKAEREAGDRAEDLLEALATTPATTLAGIAAKLDAVLREGEAWEESSEFPWPQIRSALADLVRIGRPLTPGQVFPGEGNGKLQKRQAGCGFRVSKA